MADTKARQVAWLTGASSGLGKATAEALASAGWQVVAGARSFAEANPAQEGGITRLPLDVTSQASVDAFIASALALSGTPEALVCAAGILLLGPAAQYTYEQMLSVLDVNLLGFLRLARGVLPLMIRNGGGKVAAFSSINGLMATPYQGAYVAAKHALEGFCECLRMENHDKGIQVMLVEPGDHQGGAAKYRVRSQQVGPAYRESLDRVCAVIARDEAQGLSPARLGRKVARALGKKHLPLRLRVAAFSQRAAVVLHDILPGRLFLFLLSKYYKV